jgi:hypothetical protein
MPFDRISGPESSPASTPRRTASASPPISQSELETYRELKDRLDEMKERLQVQRLDLIRRLLDGAAVQPGRLRAVASTYAQRQLNATKLAEVLGAEAVEELKNLVTPTIQTQLRLTQEL